MPLPTSRTAASRVIHPLVALLVAVAGLVVAAAPASAANLLGVQITPGPTIRVTSALTDLPLADLKVTFTSTSDTSKTWIVAPTNDLLGLATSQLDINPRNLDGTGDLLSYRYVSSTTGQKYLPNGAYTVKMTYTGALGAVASNTASLTSTAFSMPPLVTAPLPSTSMGTDAASLAVTFPQTPRAQTAKAVWSGKGSSACTASVVTLDVTQTAPVPTSLTATLPYDGSTPTISTGGSVTGSWVRGCSYDLVVSWQNVAQQPGIPDTVAFPNPSYPLSGTRVANLKVPAVPDVVGGLTAERGDGQSTVSWTAPADNGSLITGYTVQARDAVTDVPAGLPCVTLLTTCTIEGLTNGTSYVFAVRAINAVGNSLVATTSALTPAGTPLAPGDPTATRGNGKADVSWAAAAGNGLPVLGYTVTASPGGRTCTTNGALSCTVEGLDNGTEYTFKVVASNLLGLGLLSAVSNAVTPATIPGVPTSASAVRGDGTAVVSWLAPLLTGGLPIDGYTVTASPGGRTCTTSGALSCTVEGLDNGTAYTFKVAAENGLGLGLLSDATAAVVPAGLPTQVTDPVVAGGNGQATVSWLGALGNGLPITGYEVTSSPGGKTCTTQGALTCTVEGLTNGTAYTFTIKALNDLGSGLATITEAVVPATVPGLPTSVDAVRGDAQATVSWLAPLSDGGSGILGYTVTASPGGQTCQTTSSLSCTVHGLDNGTAYTFVVTATNLVGISLPSPASGPVTPAGVPGAPTNVVATPGDANAAVTWSAPADDGGEDVVGYTVTSAPDGRTCTTTGTLGCTVTGLTNGTSYTFTVTATNGRGEGASSAPAAPVTPQAPPVTEPTMTGAVSKVAKIAAKGKAIKVRFSVSQAKRVTLVLSRGPITVRRSVATKVGANAKTLTLKPAARVLLNGKKFTFTLIAKHQRLDQRKARVVS